jgi:hypothetical protein
MMSDEETTTVTDPNNPEPKPGSPVMLLVIIGGVFVALILFGVFAR